MRMLDIIGRIPGSVYSVKLKTSLNQSAASQKKLPFLKTLKELLAQPQNQLSKCFQVFHLKRALFSLNRSKKEFIPHLADSLPFSGISGTFHFSQLLNLLISSFCSISLRFSSLASASSLQSALNQMWKHGYFSVDCSRHYPYQMIVLRKFPKESEIENLHIAVQQMAGLAHMRLACSWKSPGLFPQRKHLPG